jgi:hypothetical protein
MRGRRFWIASGASGKHESKDDGDRSMWCPPTGAHTGVLRSRRGQGQRHSIRGGAALLRCTPHLGQRCQ